MKPVRHIQACEAQFAHLDSAAGARRPALQARSLVLEESGDPAAAVSNAVLPAAP